MNILGSVQRLGKALMLPIAILPIAALLLRLGAPDVLNIPFMSSSGNAIISNLPLLFALGIGIGLSKDEHGSAGLAAAVSYFVLVASAKAINPDIDMSFFAGFIAGIIGGVVYNKFNDVKLPEWLGFFAGKRLPPIMSGIITLIFGFAAGYLWPYAQNGLNEIAQTVLSSGSIGEFGYGVLNRLLLPFGLHHVINSYIWFLLGSCQQIQVDPVAALHGATHLCVDPSVTKDLVVGQSHTFYFNNSVTPEIQATVTKITNNIVNGDISRFLAGDKSAGVYLAGFFPVMMGGLPGAALAMYFAAPKENRAIVGGILFSLGFTAFLTGITEPLEFSFVFIAPVLFLIHAILTGLSLVISNAFGILDGFGFSAGAIDYVLNWGLATKPLALLVQIIAFFFIYFIIFYFSIKFFKLKTPGREDDFNATTARSQNSKTEQETSERGKNFIVALGGDDNIEIIDSCITRLRLTLRDSTTINENELKRLGAKAIVKLSDKNIQVILGTIAEQVAKEIKASKQ